MTRLIQSAGSDATEQFGERLGRKLKGGEVIELISDLGGGKTTLVRGIARGAGSKHVVSSPTFTISKVYTTPQFEIHHFDFYRLPDAGLIEHEVRDVLADSRVVIIVEWGNVIQHVLPQDRLTVTINKTSEDSRQFELTYPPPLKYLVETL